MVFNITLEGKPEITELKIQTSYVHVHEASVKLHDIIMNLVLCKFEILKCVLQHLLRLYKLRIPKNVKELREFITALIP